MKRPAIHLPLLLAACFSVGCATRVEDVLAFRDLGMPGLEDGALGRVEDLAPALCTTANVALCDSFEAPVISMPPWFEVLKASSLAIDSARAHRGRQSIHVQSFAMADAFGLRQSELTEETTLPQPELWMRFYVYLASPMPVTLLRLAGALQADAPNEGPQLVIRDGKWGMLTPGGDVISTQVPPLDRWVCIEWHVRASAAGLSDLYIDDVEVPSARVVGSTTTSPPLGRFSIGSFLFSHPEPVPVQDIWFDDVILNAARVGCDR